MWHYLLVGLACAAFALGGNAGMVWLVCQMNESKPSKTPRPPRGGRLVPLPVPA